MDSFDTNKVWPQNIVLKGAQNHLYRIGLNLEPNGKEKELIFTILYLFSALILQYLSKQ
jgi:hypothetical protein